MKSTNPQREYDKGKAILFILCLAVLVFGCIVLTM